MNVIGLLTGLQAQRDEATARAADLRGQIEYLTAALAESEARLADLATTRRIITELTPTGAERDLSGANTQSAVAILMSVVCPRHRWRWRLSGAARAGCCQGLRRHLLQCTVSNPSVLPAGQVRRCTTHPFRVAEEM